MKKIGIIGAGHVGLVTGACFAKLENSVICVDNDKEKIKKLKNGVVPFYEPGLQDIVRKQLKNKRLFFSDSIDDLVESSEIIFICVGTPSSADGRADLSYVEQASVQIARALNKIKKFSSKKIITSL